MSIIHQCEFDGCDHKTDSVYCAAHTCPECSQSYSMTMHETPGWDMRMHVATCPAIAYESDWGVFADQVAVRAEIKKLFM